MGVQCAVQMRHQRHMMSIFKAKQQENEPITKVWSERTYIEIKILIFFGDPSHVDTTYISL